MGVYADVPPTTYCWPWAATLTCKTCGQCRAYRINPIGRIPAVLKFCPICGAELAPARSDTEQDMFEMWSIEIAQKLDPPSESVPLPLVKMLYEAWDWQHHGTFIEYALKEIENG